MANFKLKIALESFEKGWAGMAFFRLKIVIFLRRDRQEWRILGLR